MNLLDNRPLSYTIGYTIVFIKEKFMIALWLLHTKKKKR